VAHESATQIRLERGFDKAMTMRAVSGVICFVLFSTNAHVCAAWIQTTEVTWHRVSAGPFSILAPSGWEFHQLQGIDSFVGEFVGDKVVLSFDFGEYSNPLKEEKKPAYVVVSRSIGGHSARIVSPKTPGRGITGIYFHDVGDSNALTLWGNNLTSAQQELVLKMFETLRFGGPYPRYVLPPPPSPGTRNFSHLPN
jgi:hypothetical protein